MHINYKRFCEEFVACGSATEAYRKVYNKPGRKPMTDKVAQASSSRLMAKPEILAKIAELNEKVASSKIADIKEIQEFLTLQLRRQDKDTIVATIQEEIVKTVPDKNGIKTVKRSKPTTVEVPTKISDAIKAAEILARMKGAFVTNVNVNGALPIIISGEDEIPD